MILNALIYGGRIMITNTDATLYSRKYNSETRLDEWERTYIPEVWWYKNEKSQITTDGLKQADTYTVRIPDTSVKIKKDDYLVKGDCKVDMQTIKDLGGLDKTRITSANYNTFGGNPHIKAVGV